METSTAGNLPVLAPLLLVVFLTGCGLAFIWLFGEPNPTSHQSYDEDLNGPGAWTPSRMALNRTIRRAGCLSRRVVRIVLHQASLAIAVISLGVLFGAAIAFIVYWILGAK